MPEGTLKFRKYKLEDKSSELSSTAWAGDRGVSKLIKNIGHRGRKENFVITLN